MKKDRLFKFGHAVPSGVLAIVFALHFLPRISATYAAQLEENGAIFPVAIICALIPILFLNGLVLEIILDRTDKTYCIAKKG